MNATVIAWVCSVAALGLAAVAWLPWVGANIRHPTFTSVAVRIIAVASLDRVKKLVAAAPASPYAQGVGAALAELDRADGCSAGELEVRVRDAFRATMRAGLARLERRAWLGLVAIGLAAVPFYLVVEGARWESAMPAGVAVGLVAHAARIRTKIAVEGAAEFEKLCPALIAAQVRAPA